jgi:hypothetical protein
MRNRYFWPTKAGIFYIAESEGRFHPVFREESLSSYATPEQAAEDLAGGHTFSPPDGIDTSRLGIPYDVREWEDIQRTESWQRTEFRRPRAEKKNSALSCRWRGACCAGI